VNVAALDVNLDGNMDLFLSNDTPRQDGMPATNRLFLNSGSSTNGFSAAPSLGLDTEVSHSSIGATRGCAQGGDFTGDGWPDLMVCSGYKQGVLLYENNGGTSFTDVSAQMKAPSGNVRHAILADMNGDGVLDLVYIYANKLVVALQQNGVFQTSFSTNAGLTDAARVAVGDVDGDLVPDIYVVQGALDTSNPPDSVYVNNGSGTSFTSLSVPETTLGAGDDVVPIDYDGNGLTDFLVLNGWHSHPGPIQLIAFFPSGSAQLRRAEQEAAAWTVSHGPGRVPAQPDPSGEDGE